jgi:general secretion pathway protein L
MVQKIVGIDLGSHSVKAVTISARGKAPSPGRAAPRAAFDVLNWGEAIVRPAADGEDGAATLRERQGEALQELKQRGALDGDLFVTGLPGDSAAVKSLTFPFNDRAKINVALPFTLEDEIALDLDDIVYSHVFVEGATSRVRDKGSEVLCAYARKDAVQEVLDQLAISGVDPRHVELDAMALTNVWDGVFAAHHGIDSDGPTELRTPGGTVIETVEGAPSPCVAVVDIGHRHTSVCVIASGRAVSAHTLLHGGADATRALARELSLPLEEAERGKRKEAFIEVQGAVAQFPEQQQISDVLKKAYAPVVRRLRQIFQATISASRLRIVKVVLTGGGSKVLNLERHIAEELNVKVVRGAELGMLLHAMQKPPLAVDDGTPVDAGVESALAFAYALSGLSAARSTSRLDFRTGPFAWKGDYDFLRERVPALSAWAAALVVALGLGAAAQAVMLSREESALLEKQLKLCQEITGEKTDSTSRCIALIQERINGTAGFSVPETSATDVFLEISRRLPYATETRRKITELDVTSERVRLKGTTTSYDAIDTMVERLQGGRCFELVEKGKARNINADTIEMNITINLDCAKAPGDGKEPPPPPGPSAAQLRAATAAKPASAAAPTTTPSTAPSNTPTFTPPAVPAMPGMPGMPGGPPGFPPSVPAANDDGGGGFARPTAEAIEERRERLKKLREDRELRRKQMITNPMQRQQIRDRFAKPALVEGQDGDD